MSGTRAGLIAVAYFWWGFEVFAFYGMTATAILGGVITVLVLIAVAFEAASNRA